MLSDRIVKGEGRVPNKLMLVGEAPGQEEAAKGRPFVGKTGKEQDAHLERNHFDRRDFYLTNLRKTYVPGNPAPTVDEIKRWGPILEQEIALVKPKFIMAVGSHAVRYFLGENAHLEAIHGIPHSFPDRGYTVLPCYHPAAHFYAPDLLQFIVYDYKRAAAAIRGNIPLHPPTDAFPNPSYIDADDRDLDRLTGVDLAYDTEGIPGNVWSFQLSDTVGTGLVFRRDNPRFGRALRGFKRLVRGKRLIGHNQLYELEMFRSLDVDLLDWSWRVKFWDTMMAAYLHCLEPQSLKNLARRHCGMTMADYSDTVGDVGIQKQLLYLEDVYTSPESVFPKPEPRPEHNNNGTWRVYTPQPIQRRAGAILADVYSGKKNEDGSLVNPYKRWKGVDRELRLMVEKVLGPMPVGTLADIPLEKAIWYAGRDPDATLRVFHALAPSLKTQKLDDLMRMKMRMYPTVAHMKLNGMLAHRPHFEKVRDDMLEEMDRIAIKISKKYYGGRPFNPNSSDQVATLMRRQGLVGEKKTKTGKVSTSKKSIEHLRYDNDAIEQVELWRERAKVKDSFAETILDLFPEGAEYHRIMGDLKITRVSSGRFSMADPNLLAIPVRTRLGLLIRAGFVASPGYVLGTWDLDQIEMRVMADESGDPSLCKIFNDGKIDVHTDTAATIFSLPYQQLEEDKALRKMYRDPAKRANFGVITGIQGPGLYDQLRMAGAKGWSVDKCDKLIREVLNLRPGIKQYMEKCGEECVLNGGVIFDRWGMPRYLPGILSDDKYERWEAKRQSHSHKIQGGAQGLLQNAMGWLYEQLAPYGDAVRWILQVHDELILEVADGLQEEVDRIMIEGLSNHGAKLKVPVRSKGGFGPNWAALEK